MQQTTATTEYDANAAAHKTVRSGAVYDLDAQERRREGIERAGRLREVGSGSIREGQKKKAVRVLFGKAL